MATNAPPRLSRNQRGKLEEPSPTPASSRITRPGKSVFSTGLLSSWKRSRVASPQTQFSSELRTKTESGPENSSTVEGGRVASG